MTASRYILRTDGTREELSAPLAMDELHRRLGCDTFDVVTLHHLGRPLHVMLVDDAGYDTEAVQRGDTTVMVPLRARKPLNVEATRLYHANCVPGTTHQIVGDVAVVPDQDFGVGP